jgi:hypothetical protein
VLQLPQVTLCCIDAKNHAMALRALERSRREIRFARTLFLTEGLPHDSKVAQDIEVIPSGAIRSHEDYSRIVLKDLYSHVTTSHVLLVQWDGYVAHPELWMDEFLATDYLGAPWPDGMGGYSVGNGGFSLRSRKLLAALQDPKFSLTSNAEDVTICGHHRPHLEADYGIRFGTSDLAKWFSFEMGAADMLFGAKTFGFHGFFNLFLVETEAEIVAMAPLLSDSIVLSEAAPLLLKNLMMFRQFEGAIALAARIQQIDPTNADVADAVMRARYELRVQRATSRKENQPGVARRILQKLRH